LRGNITTLKRNGLNGGSWTSNGYTAGTYGLIDDLTYTYGTGNQLTKVRDISLLDKGFKSVNNPNSTHYTYDANGNLKSDLNKGILLIEYNVLNLPQVITFTNNRQLQWVYDASGAKLRKMVLENGSVKETRDYVNGVEYKNRLLERVSHSEGAVVLNEYGNDQHEYVLRDHLGNTRVTFRDGTNKGTYFDWNTWSYKNLDPNYDDGLVTKDDIVQINNYYPFGLNMEGDWNGAPGNNKYQYNGKEWNDNFGLGLNDYGFRMYDPMVGRWWVQDPLTDSYPDITSYHYAVNSPINFIDEMGLDTAKPTVLPTVTITAPRHNPTTISVNYSVGQTLNFFGDNNIATRVKFTGSTPGTSIASQYFRTKFPQKTPRMLFKALPKRVGVGRFSMPLRSNKLGAVVGRSVPLLGRGFVGASVILSVDNIIQSENKPEASLVEGAGMLGAYGGTEAGAAVGASIGVWFGGVGAVPGAVIGGIIGGAGGYFGGRNAGQLIYNNLNNNHGIDNE
jgi:RHS repeat-associated protein